MRLIDADALIDKYGDWYTEEETEEGYIGTIKGIVDSIPTIEPERRWIPCSERMTCKYRMVDANMKYWQTDCGRKIRHKKQGWNYCPYCGKEIGWVRSDWVEANHERKD